MPSYASAGEAGDAGRLVRCPYCDRTWLARRSDDDAFSAAGTSVASRPRRPPLIIEGEVVRPIRFAAAKAAAAPSAGYGRRAGFGARYGFAAGAAALILMLAAAVLLTPAVSARPQAGAAADGLSLEGVSSRTVTHRGRETILVEGAIVNRTAGDADVPAVRVALTERGSEVYSWLVEPTVMRLGAGESVGFRSAMASPRAGASHVTLRLSGRDAAAGKDR